MQIIYVMMTLAGLIAIVLGFRASYHAKHPWDIVGSISLPVGLLVCLLGVLLISVPNFFKG